MENVLNECIQNCETCALKCVVEKLDCVDCCLLCESICKSLKTAVILNSKKTIVNSLKKTCIISLKDCIHHCSAHNNSHCKKCAQSCSKLLNKLSA